MLPRLAYRHGLTGSEIDELIDILSIQAELIEPEPHVEGDLRDDADQPVLITWLAVLRCSEADYLVTGDKDLLVLFERYPIVTPAEFWSRHAGF